MPLVVITGLPASGKTFRAKQLKHYFEDRGKIVHVISESDIIVQAGYEKNQHFRDSYKERQTRSNIKSEAIRTLNKNEIVILDGANYIKGFRYEMFCVSKASRTTQCTIYCAITTDQAMIFNEMRKGNDIYQKDVFDALCLRYEAPQHNNRWDSPLFTVFPDEDLEELNIYNSLFECTSLTPNLSTQNVPLSSTNYLFEMDRISQNIIDHVLSARKLGLTGPVNIQDLSVNIPCDVNAPQMNRCRRQFLNYMKLHVTTPSSIDKIPSLFVKFLNSNCK